jgi:guanylate kinase
MKAVLARSGHQIHQLSTATTRPIRPDEKQGREHQFVTPAEFEDMIARGALLEHQVVHGHLYGIPRSTVEAALLDCDDLIADVEVFGATYTRSCYPNNSILIFIKPPALDVLRTRMQARGESQEEIEKRLRRVEMEMQYAPLCDYLIINDDINRAADELYAIILSAYSRRDLERLRLEQQLPRHRQTAVVTVIPVYNGEVLQCQHEPRFPTGSVTDSQLVVDAASSALVDSLGIEVNRASLRNASWTTSPADLPDAMDNLPPEYFQHTTLYYFYPLPQRVTPPGFEWLPVEQVALPDGCRDALATFCQQV